MKNLMSKPFFICLTSLVSVIGLSACNNVPKGEAKFPTGADRAATSGDIYAKPDSIFGNDGLSIFGKNKKKADDGTTGIGVNSFLWRATLDTLSFMPLASADPFGGVVITDWYSDPEKPNERFKVNAFILDKQLVSTGIEVKVFRQAKKGSNWHDANVADDLGTKLEDSILTRARQLRVAANAK